MILYIVLLSPDILHVVGNTIFTAKLWLEIFLGFCYHDQFANVIVRITQILYNPRTSSPCVSMTTRDISREETKSKQPLVTSPNDVDSKNLGHDKNKLDNGISDVSKVEQNKIQMERKQKDTRWNWVILFATFFNYIVVSAIWYSFSVLYKEFAIHFDTSLASAGVLASVEAASLHFTGAFCSGLVEKFGSRPVAMVGSFIGAAALFSGAFVNSMTALYVVYGVAGSGIGLSYVSFVVIIQQYFNKRRTIASGFSLTGFSIASFSLPPFTRWLLDQYGWRGTLIIISCFYLNGIVLAALLRPPPKPAPQRTRTRHRSFSEKLTKQMSIEKTKSRMSGFCKVCRKVFDYKMFKEPRFILYGLGTFFMMIGNIAFFMHLINRAVSLGIETHMATFLPSIYGIANGVCRLIFSVIANLPKSNRTIQYGLWIIAGGFISCMSSFATNFIGLAIVCAGFGMCVGAFICIQYPALVDLLGVQKIARSTGLLQLFIGSAGLIATPLAGWIYDVTNDYNIPYYVLGSIMMLGGAIVLIIPCLSFCEDRGHVTDMADGSQVKRQRRRSLSVTSHVDEAETVVVVLPGSEKPNDINIFNKTETQTKRMRALSSDSYLEATV